VSFGMNGVLDVTGCSGCIAGGMNCYNNRLYVNTEITEFDFDVEMPKCMRQFNLVNFSHPLSLVGLSLNVDQVRLPSDISSWSLWNVESFVGTLLECPISMPENYVCANGKFISPLLNVVDVNVTGVDLSPLIFSSSRDTKWTNVYGYATKCPGILPEGSKCGYTEDGAVIFGPGTDYSFVNSFIRNDHEYDIEDVDFTGSVFSVSHRLPFKNIPATCPSTLPDKYACTENDAGAFMLGPRMNIADYDFKDFVVNTSVSIELVHGETLSCPTFQNYPHVECSQDTEFFVVGPKIQLTEKLIRFLPLIIRNKPELRIHYAQFRNYYILPEINNDDMCDAVEKHITDNC